MIIYLLCFETPLINLFVDELNRAIHANQFSFAFVSPQLIHTLKQLLVFR